MRGWLDRYSEALGAPPIDEKDIDKVLALAGVAAHASERTAAPLSCYLVALSGTPLPRALEIAQGLARELEGEEPQASA